MADGFELLCASKANEAIPTLKYRSKRTGITIYIAQVEGPLVNGYFCLATEAHDDDGLPHTLEHLIFMGSEKYPYKGLLDLLANRCLASGTNAWTDTDHTCYTMTTAGSQGFLTLMPIYLDHILYPLLTDSAYLTEVHHVNGEGEDAGVVYCEMQARENSGESLTHLELLRAMYPGHCGYKSETGGIMKNLRTSTSNEKVRSYHKEFYRAENLSLIITGQVDPGDVFAAITPFEDNILSKNKLSQYIRPWQSLVPNLPGTRELTVPFPSDDESVGMFVMSWRGPSAKDQYTVTAVKVLFEYLTDSAIAPFQRDFVETENPLCSNVRFNIIENAVICFYIRLENVPKESLPLMRDRVEGLLSKIGKKAEQIDMKRMNTVIHRQILESLDHVEDQPHDTLAFIGIGDALFGNDQQDLTARLNIVEAFKRLKQEKLDYWHELLTKYVVGQKAVIILGEPSKKVQEEMVRDDKERMEEQCKQLGEKGLKDRDLAVEKATQENEVEPPVKILTSVDVPEVSRIKFHPIKTSHNKETEPAIQDFPLAAMPVTFRLDDIHSNFVQMNVLMETSSLPVDLKMYLPLYCEVLFELPILRDGGLVPYEDVIAQLQADTLYTHASLGLGGGKFNCGSFAQLACITLKVEMEKYEKGVQWLRELLYDIKFTAERLKIVASKMANDVARMKRNGRQVAKSISSDITFTKGSNRYTNNMMRQHTFLTRMTEKLNASEYAEKVLSDMKRLQEHLTSPENVVVHVSTDVTKLCKVVVQPNTVWEKSFLPAGKVDSSNTDHIPTVSPSSGFLLPQVEGQRSGVIAGVGSVESSFLLQSVPCITSYLDPDLPALMLFIQYLTQLEGPMWRQLRGLGLVYHYSLFVAEESGLLYLLLMKSTHLVNAYKQAKIIVDNYVSGSTPFTDVELETSKSSLIFEIIERETTVGNVAKQSILSYYRNVETGYNRSLLSKISDVTITDLKRVGSQYVTPLFDASKSRCAVCCNPGKVKEVKDGFHELGRTLEELNSLEDGFLAKY